MILLDPIVEILVRPVLHPFVQFSLDRLRVAIVSIRRNPRRNETGQGFHAQTLEIFDPTGLCGSR